MSPWLPSRRPCPGHGRRGPVPGTPTGPAPPPPGIGNAAARWRGPEGSGRPAACQTPPRGRVPSSGHVRFRSRRTSTDRLHDAPADAISGTGPVAPIPGPDDGRHVHHGYGKVPRPDPSGARQICAGPAIPACPSFPEVVEPVAVNGAPQGGDGVGAVDAPVHAAALQPAGGHGPAGSLDDPRRDAQVPLPEPWIVHARPVRPEVGGVPLRLPAAVRMCMPGEFLHDEVGTPLVQPVPPGLPPPRRKVAPRSVKGLGDVEEVLPGPCLPPPDRATVPPGLRHSGRWHSRQSPCAARSRPRS